MKRFITLIFITISLMSCVQEEEGPKSEFDVPLKWAHINDSKDWDSFLKTALEQQAPELMEKTPGDIQNFTKNYTRMNYNERLNFWAYLVSIMAEKESNFNPKAFYKEAFYDANGNNVISRGLLQLSIESARGYKCPVKDGPDLHDPEKNLICTVLILKRWVLTDGVISGNSAGKWRGGARYWSVLRKKNTLDFFTKHTLANF